MNHTQILIKLPTRKQHTLSVPRYRTMLLCRNWLKREISWKTKILMLSNAYV